MNNVERIEYINDRLNMMNNVANFLKDSLLMSIYDKIAIVDRSSALRLFEITMQVINNIYSLNMCIKDISYKIELNN